MRIFVSLLLLLSACTTSHSAEPGLCADYSLNITNSDFIPPDGDIVISGAGEGVAFERNELGIGTRLTTDLQVLEGARVVREGDDVLFVKDGRVEAVFSFSVGAVAMRTQLGASLVPLCEVEVEGTSCGTVRVAPSALEFDGVLVGPGEVAFVLVGEERWEIDNAVAFQQEPGCELTEHNWVLAVRAD